MAHPELGTHTAQRRLSLNTIALFAASLLSPIAGFFVVAYISRNLGTTVFGEYMVAYSWYFLITPLADLGLSNYLIRHLSRITTSFGTFATKSLLLGFAAGSLGGFLMWASASIVGHSESAQQGITVLAATMGVTNIVPILHSILISQEKAGVVLLSEAVESATRVGLSLIAVRLGYGVPWLMAAFVLGRLLAVSLCLFFLGRYRFISWRGKDPLQFSLRGVLQEALPFAWIAWLNIAYWRTGTLILAKIQGDAALGIYSAANKLFQVLQLAPRSIMLAFFPRLSHRFLHARVTFESLVEFGTRILLAASILPALLLTLTARTALQLTYKLPEFQEAEPVLLVLVWALLFYAARLFLVRVMMAADLERSLTRLLTIGTLAGVLLNTALVYWMGAVGLAIATLLNLVGISGMLALSMYRNLSLSARVLNYRRLAGILLATGLAAGVGYSLRGVSWPLAVLSCTVTYIVTVLLTRSISPAEIGISLSVPSLLPKKTQTDDQQ